MSMKLKSLFEFGPYRLETAERSVGRDGQMVPLTLKALDTLVVLVSNGGRLVEKEDLLKAVWPDTFVEEGNLAVQISLLRMRVRIGAPGSVPGAPTPSSCWLRTPNGSVKNSASHQMTK